MQGRFQAWLGLGVAALLFAGASAQAGDLQQMPYLTSDPGYPSQGAQTQLVSNNASSMNFEARIAALEAALADKEEEEIKWEDQHGKKWSTKIGGRIMGDYVLYPDVDAAIEGIDPNAMAENYFEFRRLRIFLKGTGYGVYDYKFQLDWEKGDTTVVKDMYVGIHDLPIVDYVRMGHFYGPVGLETQTSSKYITFMERALPTASFGTDRRLGIGTYTNSANDTFHLQTGAFIQAFDAESMDAVNDEQGIRLAARGVWTPVYTANGRGVLHFGAGVEYVDDADDSVRFRARPEVHHNNRWLDTAAWAAHDYTVYALEGAMVYGPASVQTELFYSSVDSIGADNLDLYGGYIYASYFLTGENRVYENDEKVFGRVKPHTNFWIVPTCNGPAAGWGAWELAGRWSWLDFTDPALAGVGSAGQLNDLTLGVNWYWNPYTRVMFEYIHPFLNRNDIGAAEADILGMRVQVDF